MIDQDHSIDPHLKTWINTYTKPSQTIWVALSGGIDSCVLLHALHRICQTAATPSLHAIHFNHLLHPQSGEWAKFCKKFCDRLAVPLIQIEDDFSKRARPQKGIEAAARIARYQAFASHLPIGADVYLAHHMQDQAETVLKRFCQGQGVSGLKSIPTVRTHDHIRIMRPFLSISKNQIISYAQTYRVEYIEDPSNQALHFERNFLRHRALPILTQQYPHLIQSLNQAQRCFNETHELLNILAEIDLHTLQASRTDCIDLNIYLNWSIARQINLIRHWLFKHKIKQPDQKQLKHFCVQLSESKADKNPQCELHSARLQRYRNHLYLIRSQRLNLEHNTPWPLRLAPHTPYQLPYHLGYLMIQPKQGQGLASLQGLTLQFRKGGESIIPHNRRNGGHRRLKKYFSERHVLPWARDCYPLIYQHGILACIPNLSIHSEAHCSPDEIGWTIEWIPTPYHQPLSL